MEGEDQLTEHMRLGFEAELPRQLERAREIKLQNIIPGHWFAHAASECARMYVSGFFYGCISVSQAYVEALSRFLILHHKLRQSNDINLWWKRLKDGGAVSVISYDAAIEIYSDRNDFHHLNESVPSEHIELKRRAQCCINGLHAIESEVFAYSFSESEPGAVVLKNPSYWPSSGPEQAQVFSRQLWL